MELSGFAICAKEGLQTQVSHFGNQFGVPHYPTAGRQGTVGGCHSCSFHGFAQYVACNMYGLMDSTRVDFQAEFEASAGVE